MKIPKLQSKSYHEYHKSYLKSPIKSYNNENNKQSEDICENHTTDYGA